MDRSILLSKWCQHLVDTRLADVYQHVRVREPFHRSDLIPLQRLRNAVQRLTTVVLLKHLPVCDRRDAVIVELQPAGLAVRLDKCKVMTAMEVAGVHEHAVKLVHPRL